LIRRAATSRGGKLRASSVDRDGWLTRTARGRTATPKARRRFGHAADHEVGHELETALAR